jgi:hypothetical protein
MSSFDSRTKTLASFAGMRGTTAASAQTSAIGPASAAPLMVAPGGGIATENTNIINAAASTIEAEERRRAAAETQAALLKAAKPQIAAAMAKKANDAKVAADKAEAETAALREWYVSLGLAPPAVGIPTPASAVPVAVPVATLSKASLASIAEEPEKTPVSKKTTKPVAAPAAPEVGVFAADNLEHCQGAAEAPKPSPASAVVKAKAAKETPAAAESKEEISESSRRGTYKMDQANYDKMYRVVEKHLPTVATNIVCGIKGLSGKDTFCLKNQAKNPKAYHKYHVLAPLKISTDPESPATERFEEAAAGGFIKHFSDLFEEVENAAQRRIRHTLVAAALLGELAFSQGHAIKCQVPLAETLRALVFDLLAENKLEAEAVECRTKSCMLTLKVFGLRSTAKAPAGAVSASAPVSGGGNAAAAKKAPKTPSYASKVVASGGAGSETSFSQEEVAELKKAIKDAMKAKDFALVASLGAALTAMTQ